LFSGPGNSYSWVVRFGFWVMSRSAVVGTPIPGSYGSGFGRFLVQRTWELLFLSRTVRALGDFRFSGPGNSYSWVVRIGIWVMSCSAVLGTPIPGSYGSGFGRFLVQRTWELLFLSRTVRDLGDFWFSGPGNSYSSVVRSGIWVISGSEILGTLIPRSYGSGFCDFSFSLPGNSYSSVVIFGVWVISGSAVLGIPIPRSYVSGFG
jgi:hypothetical protein